MGSLLILTIISEQVFVLRSLQERLKKLGYKRHRSSSDSICPKLSLLLSKVKKNSNRLCDFETLCL